MADIFISVDCKQAQGEVRYLLNDVNQLNKAAKQPKVISLDTSNGLFPKDTQYVKNVTGEGTLDKMRQFGKEVRGLHIYGINPLTRSLAKLGSTLLGSFIHPITLAATALMGLGVAAKKVFDFYRDTNDQIISKNNAIMEISKNKIDMIQKQKNAYNELLNKIKELQKQNRALTDSEKLLMQVYVQKINKQNNATNGKKARINPATGKLQNVEELQGQLFDRQNELSRFEYEKQLDASNKLLDAYLGKALPFYKNTTMFSKGDFSQVPNLDELFPWLQKSSSYKNIDISKLYSMDPVKQAEFFREVIEASKDIADINEAYKPFIAELAHNTEIRNKINETISPLNKVANQTTAINKELDSISTSQDDIKKSQEETRKAIEKQKEDDEFNKLSTRQQSVLRKAQSVELNIEAKELGRQIKQNEKFIKESGATFDENGKLTTERLQEFYKNSNQLLELDEQLDALQKKKSDRLQEETKTLLPLIDVDDNKLEEFHAIEMAHGRGDTASAQQEQEYEDYKKNLAKYNSTIERINKQLEPQFTRIQNKIKQLTGESNKIYNEEHKKLKLVAQKMAENKTLEQEKGKKQTEANKASIEAANLKIKAGQEEADAAKKRLQQIQKQRDFFKKLRNGAVQHQFENSNIANYSRFQQLQQQLLALRGPGAKLTKDDLDKLWKYSKVDELNRKIVEQASKQQYTFRNDDFARKGGGYGLTVTEKNLSARSIIDLERQANEYLRQIRDNGDTTNKTLKNGSTY